MSTSNMIYFPRLPAVSSNWQTHPPKPQPQQPSRNNRSLKQSRSSESLNQRKDRVDFLRQREFTRRIAAGGNDQPVLQTRRERTYSWQDIVAAADAVASTYDYPNSRRPHTISESDEDDDASEPYVIYTATPRSAASSSHSSSHTSSALAAPSAYAPYTPYTPGPTVIYSTSNSSPGHSPTLLPVSAAAPVPAARSSFHARRVSWRGPHSRHSSLSSISEEDEGLVRF